MSKDIGFLIDGRIITIERFEDETDASFAERSSFILFFRNDPEKYKTSKTLSFYHVNKMFKGVIYRDDLEELLKEYRREMTIIRNSSL